MSQHRRPFFSPQSKAGIFRRPSLLVNTCDYLGVATLNMMERVTN